MGTATAEDREFLSAGEAGKRIGVGRAAVERWFRQGRIEGFKLPSGHLRIYADAIERIRSGQTTTTAAG